LAFDIDTLMVSNVGEAAVSGTVSLVDSINRIFFYIFLALSTGGAIEFPPSTSDAKIRKMQKIPAQVFMLTLLFPFLSPFSVIIGRRPFLTFIYGSLDADVMRKAVLYFMLTPALANPAIAVQILVQHLFRASGNSKFPMLVS
jgi:Na+-driven multidrug efflux pump